MIGEGLTMYLTEQDGIALLRRVVDAFPSGELQFDAFTRFGIKTQWTNARGEAVGGDAALGHRRPRRHHSRRCPVCGCSQWDIAVRLADLRRGVVALPGDGAR